jgi:hypothetical protein
MKYSKHNKLIIGTISILGIIPIMLASMLIAIYINFYYLPHIVGAITWVLSIIGLDYSLS